MKLIVFAALFGRIFQTATAWKINTDLNHEGILMEGPKKIVFLAGPHNSAYMSVQKYIANWANPFMVGHIRSKALSNWRWAGDDIHKLILEPDEANTEVWEHIKEKFQDENSNGAIIGSANFDQIGSAASHDALSVMKKIIEYLGAQPSDVTVILNYRTPRLDQWTSMWKHAEEDYAESTYEDWLCDTHDKEHERNIRLDMLGARTNPLNAANEFLNQGWDVKMLETAGLEAADINIVQVIVCQILQGTTVEGPIFKHEYVSNHANEGDKEFTELNGTDAELAEELFRFRDCAYQNKLKGYLADGKMDLLYNHSMFATCDGSKDFYYQRLAENPEIMYSALLGQLKCPNHEVEWTGKTIGQAVGIEEETTEEKKASSIKKEKSKSSSGGGNSMSSLLPVLLALIFTYQVYKLNLKRPMRKAWASSHGTAIETLEMGHERDPKAEMVALTGGGGKPNND
jgi:hypothetical protein